MGRAQDYIRKEFGFDTETRNNVVAGAAAAGVVLQNNPNRVSWTIINLGAAVGYVGFTSGVGAANGIRLAATGGLAGFGARDDGETPVREVWGIGLGATFYVIEVVSV